jgi:bile acid:Na+ symporter, BASS family
MLLTAAGTVIFMPLAVPALVAGFSADAWTIAKPLIF